jgi:GAF domain-containing protein
MNLLHHLQPSNLPSNVLNKGALAVNREIILQYVLNLLLGIYTIAFSLILLFWPEVVRPQFAVFYIFSYFGLFSVTYFRKVNYTLRAVTVISFLLLTGGVTLTVNALVAAGWCFLFASIILANLLLNHLFGGFVYLFSIFLLVLIGHLMVGGMIPPPQSQAMSDPLSSSSWIVNGLVFLFTITISMVSVFIVVRGMDSALKTQSDLANELEKERSSLERRVEERSADLRNRVAQFEVASQIAREISGEMNLDTLLNSAVNLIRDRFTFYHVGLFLIDEKGEFAVLRAATGEAGRQMMEHNHRLKIGEIGIVGYTVSRGEARIALEVSDDSTHFRNPLLPETRSEMALPLKVGEKTIGALDVQSELINAFSNDDVQILQTIADQLAIAFQKTLLVEELQSTVSELEASYQATTRKSWREYVRKMRRKLAYRYDADTRSALELAENEIAQPPGLLQVGEPVIETVQMEEGQSQPLTSLAVPIRLRNQVLGVVNIRFEGTNISQDLILLIEGAVNRMAVSLENARLLEEIQFRAERERLVSEISSKVRAAANVDSVLQIAVQELGQSLNASEVMVQLRKAS